MTDMAAHPARTLRVSAVRLIRGARRYPLVVATLVAAAVGGILLLTPWSPATPWLLSVFGIAIALRSTWRTITALRSGTFGVDVLAVTAIVAAIAVGETWAATVVVLMLTGGEALEEFAANRAKRDLSALLARAPRTGRRVLADGTSAEVPIDAILPGDRLLVRPSEIVPVDGVLESSVGVFDESSLTGESLPVERTAGQEVLSGVVNGAAAVTLTATRPARESQYQRIVTLVEAAAASRSPLVRLADRFAIPFTLAALGIAGTAWLVSGDPVRFAEVLVVATPCPLIIAAPVAFLAGMSRSARAGAIVKSSATLEKLRRARTFAFDKTGTLTQGEPSLIDVRTSGDRPAADVLRFAAAAERASTHVLARAVVLAAEQRGLADPGTTEAHEAAEANGVTARVDGRLVVVGKRSFIAGSIGREVPVAELAADEMAVYVGVDGAFAGALVFRDEVRPNARATVDALRGQGIATVVMLTGDDPVTARHVASALGIDDIRADCLPIDKVEAVRAFPERPVVMVGDGINDAPVLAAADVGIAMGARGATAASESADVVLLRDDVALVAHAFVVARQTVAVALQSIGVGIVLSSALMLVAAFGLLPALAGAWMQEGIDVVTILWALRAARDRRPAPIRR
jgi:heavy metal translocating P-type ATPase